MKLKLKNESGMVREVPTGFSFTGFLFSYIVLLARGIFGRGLLLFACNAALMLGGCTFGLATAVGEAAQGGDGSGTAAFTALFWVIQFGFFFIIGAKINKWTARYWLDRGYKPTGPGWDVWGPKWGLEIPNSY